MTNDTGKVQHGIFYLNKKECKVKDKLIAIKLNLRLLLNRIEKLKIDKPDYEVNGKLQKAELKVDEINDIIEEIKALEEL